MVVFVAFVTTNPILSNMGCFEVNLKVIFFYVILMKDL